MDNPFVSANALGITHVVFARKIQRIDQIGGYNRRRSSSADIVIAHELAIVDIGMGQIEVIDDILRRIHRLIGGIQQGIQDHSGALLGNIGGTIAESVH